jgi:O-antigen/teichoic acid export membrane protein
MLRQSPWASLAAERFVRHNLLIAASTLLAGVLGFFMQALLSHSLMPADYGATFTILSVLALIWLPANAVMLVMAKETSCDPADRASGRSAAILWRWHRRLMLGGFLIAGVGIIGTPGLARFFHVTPLVLIPAALSVPFGLAVPALLGQLQGRQRFLNLSALLVGQAALRLVAAVALALPFGSVGVFAGVAIGNILIYVAAMAAANPSGFRRVAMAPPEQDYRSLAVILVGGIALAVLFSTDVLLVKHFFRAEEAGKYAAVAALGRAIFWGASGIALVLFPKAAVQGRKPGAGSLLVLASIGMCLVGGVMGWAIFSLEPRFLLTTFAGPAYASAGSYLPMYGVAMTLFGGASVLVATGQARGNANMLAVLVPVMLLEPALIIRFHETLTQVVQLLSVSMAVLFIGLAVLFVLEEHRRAMSPIGYPDAALLTNDLVPVSAP